MNVLHFSLGLPPYKSGGLTRYATDLMVAEKKSGLNVSLLYPGDFTFWKSRKPYISQEKDYCGVKIYELKNPAPVPLLYGVKKPADIFKSSAIEEKYLSAFFEIVKPDIFHVHTLMGLPASLIDFLKRKGVKLLYSAHDYYGLCLRTNFVGPNNKLCERSTPEVCALCNRNAPGSVFLKLRNSKYLLRYKSILRNKVRLVDSDNEQSEQAKAISSKVINEYGHLLNYYRELFGKFDFFHFNSRVTEGVYKEYLQIKRSEVISISHSGISDNRSLKKFNKENIRLSFIGNITAYKGFPVLKKVLVNLYQNGTKNWELSVWGNGIGRDPDCSQIKYCGQFSESDLRTIFNGIDLLIVPSVWRETFSLVALEAISYGVPVLVTETVGAKDIIRKYSTDFVIPNGEGSLFASLKKLLNPEDDSLSDFNRAIVNSDFHYDLNTHLNQIIQLYNQMKYL